MKQLQALMLAALCCAACRNVDSARDEAGDPVAEALAVADEYVSGYYSQYPEDAYETGYPAPMDRMGDRSPQALAAWRAREDDWLMRLRAIDPSSLAGSEAAIPARFSLERLQASGDRRVCRTELWNVSPTWTGWQNFFPGVFAKQPVGTESARAEAVSRARDVSRYIDTEIANLRIGMAEGYTAPRSNVEEVIGQVDALLSVPLEDTPYFEPASRDPDPDFRTALAGAISEAILPAARRYRDFLEDEYLAAARQDIGVTSDPGGRDCYLASVLST